MTAITPEIGDSVKELVVSTLVVVMANFIKTRNHYSRRKKMFLKRRSLR